MTIGMDRPNMVPAANRDIATVRDPGGGDPAESTAAPVRGPARDSGGGDPAVQDGCFDEEIHAPLRLRICAILAAAKTVEFSAIRDRLGVADSVASKHLSRLEDAGYVHMEKLSTGGRPRTWVSLTPVGRTAFEGHIAALRQIAAGAGW